MKTPRTDELETSAPVGIDDYRIMLMHARLLERELNHANADRNRLYSQVNTLLASMSAGHVPEYVINDIKYPALAQARAALTKAKGEA